MAVEQEFSDSSASSRLVGLSRWLGRNFWAMCDQILISAANFITMVLAARAMSKAEFGAFTLVYSALLLANVIQSTLVTQAHNVIGATRGGLSYAVYTSTTAVGQVLIIVIEALGASAAAWWSWSHHTTHAALLIALVPAIIGWQLQEFVRRVLYTEGRIGGAFANDLLSYAGQTIWIAALFFDERLDGAGALYALAWTSLAAAVYGVWQLRASLTTRIDTAVLAENWHFGKWLAGAELVGWCSSLNMYLWLAALIIGTTATGDLKAAQLVFGPTRVLAFFLGNILPIRFARGLARGGDAEMNAAFRKVLVIVVPFLGAYCLLAAIFAERLMRLYGKDYAGNASVLQLYAICAFLSYVQMVVAAALAAKRLTHSIFVSSIWGGLIALAMSWFMIKLFGSDGAVVCMGLTALIVTALFWRSYQRFVDPTSSQPIVEPESASSVDEAPIVLPSDSAGEARVEEEVLV
jgi:O-antigen/teichoic acid export membrane protein